jgi:hypothetical protein
LPEIQFPNVIDAVVIFDLKHSPLGQSISFTHRTKTTTTAHEAEWLR